MTVIAAGAVVLDGQVRRPGWLRTTGPDIADSGPGSPPGPADLELPEALIVPGFVDMHCHGGAGGSYPPDPAAPATGIDTDTVGTVAAFHRRHGTTSTLASLVTAAPDVLLDAVRTLAEATRAGVIAGIHLEGPWLSTARCGAHDPHQLRHPDPVEIDALLTVGGGAIRMVTLAPELPGALDAVRRFVDAGVVVAVGHTDASYEQTRAAIEAGASVATHLFNAMRPVHQREPGPAVALLEDPRVTVELIADGVHVHPALIRQVIDAAGPHRVALVTDAMAAAGCADGRYRLGRQDVEVIAGVARLSGTSTIAGSTATMDQLFRAAIEHSRLGFDAAVAAAVQLTATTPARAVRLGDVGSLRAGCRADLVVLNRSLQVTDVMANGRWQAAG